MIYFAATAAAFTPDSGPGRVRHCHGFAVEHKPGTNRHRIHWAEPAIYTFDVKNASFVANRYQNQVDSLRNCGLFRKIETKPMGRRI
jgi:hypothetical protein